MEEYYPVYLNLKGRKCLIVGGGQVAFRKVKALLICQANVTVVSPSLTSGLKALAESKEIIFLQKTYSLEYLENAFLVISCTNEAALNRQVAEDCFSRNIMVNVVDDLPLCNFIVPALVSRGPLSIAVSTEGKSPAFARRVREELEEKYPEVYGEFVSFLGQMRKEVISLVGCPKKRQKIFALLAGEEFFNKYIHLTNEEAAFEARKFFTSKDINGGIR